jgi:hypothetical protein
LGGEDTDVGAADGPDAQDLDCDPFQGDRIVGFATIQSDTFETLIGLTQHHVVVFAGDRIHASPRCGGVLEPVGDAAGAPHDVTSDGARVLWAESGQVFSTDPAEASTGTLAQYEGVVSAIAPSTDVIYVGLYFAGEDSGVHTIPRDGSSGRQIWATPLGERIGGLAIDGTDVYALVVRNEPSVSTRVVRLGAGGDVEDIELPEDVGTIEHFAARDGALVLRRRGNAPELTESVQARSATDGSLLWDLGSDDAPEMFQSIAGTLYGLDSGSPTRLLEIPGPQPPFELTQMPSGPGIPVRNDRLGTNFAFDSMAAYWVEGTPSQEGDSYEVLVYGRGY